ncbi:alginate lyase family protein [Longispora sp. K20-0274]|uniref:alginate lyase family protein n=1 Tax=Longispora sp. K20-0274 TaxID=3088255 RepID=UPI00399A13AF
MSRVSRLVTAVLATATLLLPLPAAAHPEATRQSAATAGSGTPAATEPATDAAAFATGTGPAAAGTGPDVATPRGAAAAFAHPGVLVSRPQLDLARAKALAGAQPWKSAYDAMRTSSFASLSRPATPRAIVECGSSSIPNNGCSDERDDATAAYTQALLWYITKDAKHAQKAIGIMDAWSAVLRDHTNSNAPLQTGWAGATFARAAELIRHTYSSWPQVTRFATMLRTVYLPEVINGRGCTNGNWELIMMDAATGIAVFLDDRASFDKAVAIWRARVPAYIYLTSDGALPRPPANCPSINTKSEIIGYWQGQSTFTDGLAQETCRDFGHTGWGLEAIAHVAETARLQGLDLYTEARPRLTQALYFHARYELGTAVPASLCGGTVKKGLGPTTEVAFNAFHTRSGLDMPTTQRYTEAQRPAGVSHFLAWETLTHANNPS